MFVHGHARICADPKPGEPETIYRIYRECSTEEFKRVSAVRNEEDSAHTLEFQDFPNP